LIIHIFFYILKPNRPAYRWIRNIRFSERSIKESGVTELFITFEGIEGCGKTTQVKRLSKRLFDNKIQFVVTLEPGGTELGEKIRKILLDSKNNTIYPLTELILYEADRAQHVEEIIKPALEMGKWVICDRFFDATVAYQGSARGQDMELIRILNEKAAQGIKPDITFLLDCPVEIGLYRARKRSRALSQEGQDRFEREKMEFHRVVRKGYLEIARTEDRRFKIIDATMSENGMELEIFNVLRSFLET
jgi:dTMP kinase